MNYMFSTLMLLSMLPLIMSMFTLFFNFSIYFNLILMNIMNFQISINILMDWMSMMFLSTVMFISSMILMFSMYYIPKKEHKQFSLMLIMFIISMSILISSNNLFMILLGWDGLGLSSYILVIYYQNHSTSSCGSITLLSNRIGDILIILSISMIMMTFQSWNFNMNEKFMLIMMLFLMIAGCSKSAQFPFSAWLPMAMAAPTPISALVHSSTLVTAGIYLMLRLMNNIHPNTMLTLMLISSMTATYAGLSANWEQDMKKIIALSTLSQMAMMMFAISIQAPLMAYIHMIIHAFFKSTMFLCAGTMIHESSYQDMRMMGMNSTNIPLTNSIMAMSNMSLMAVPFTAGYFSKDIIVEMMISSKLESFLTLSIFLSIGLTASYSLRMLIKSFKHSIPFNSYMENHTNLYSNLPIMLMSPMAISLGSMLLWMINPDQIILFPNMFKTSIMLVMLIGMLSGMMLSFKNHTYLKMGQSAISMWFTHLITTTPIKLTPLMDTFSLNDKHWQEKYGPNNLFSLSKSLSSMSNYHKKMILMVMIMTSIIPLTLIQ